MEPCYLFLWNILKVKDGAREIVLRQRFSHGWRTGAALSSTTVCAWQGCQEKQINVVKVH